MLQKQRKSYNETLLDGEGINIYTRYIKKK